MPFCCFRIIDSCYCVSKCEITRIFIIIFILIAFIVWLINKKSSFFNHNINETISGKTFFFRIIILVILQSYLLEYFDDAINLNLSENTRGSYSAGRAKGGMWFFYYLFYLLPLTLYSLTSLYSLDFLIFILGRLPGNLVFLLTAHPHIYCKYFIIPSTRRTQRGPSSQNPVNKLFVTNVQYGCLLVSTDFPEVLTSHGGT